MTKSGFHRRDEYKGIEPLEPSCRRTFGSSAPEFSLIGIFLALIVALLITILPCPAFSLLQAIIFGHSEYIREDVSYKYVSTYDGDIRQSATVPGVHAGYFSNSTLKVVLFGDSLIKYPDIYYSLTDSIREMLVDISPVQLYVEASFGMKANDLKKSLLAGDVSKHNPDAVIMFWDSDVDIDESSMTPSQVADLREAYINDLQYVVGSLASTVKYLAIAGPAILGEGHFWFMPNTDRFRNKLPMIDEYRDMNRAMAVKYNASYIDVRQAFLDYIPPCQLVYKWCVTDDGEHPNKRGSAIVAGLFSEMINGWLQREAGLEYTV